MTLTSQSAAEYFEAAAATLAVLRLFQLGLQKTQMGLLAFIAATAVFMFALGSFPPDSPAYFRTYFCFTVLSWFLGLFAVREVFALALAEYPGIRTAARRAIYVSFTASVALAIIMARATWRKGPAGHSPLLFYVELVNRSVVLTLLLFTVIFLVLLSRYPLHLQRNTRVSCASFGALFLCESLSTLADAVSPHLYSSWVDTAGVGFSAICLFVWSLLLQRESHSPKVVTFARPEETQLLRELENLNALLSRAGRK